jgi:hypothetical protein
MIWTLSSLLRLTSAGKTSARFIETPPHSEKIKALRTCFLLKRFLGGVTTV